MKRIQNKKLQNRLTNRMTDKQKALIKASTEVNNCSQQRVIQDALDSYFNLNQQ